MGNNPCIEINDKKEKIMKNIKDLKESWEYEGNIFEKVNCFGQEQYIKIFGLAGNVYIRQDKEGNQIFIVGRIKEKRKKYFLSGKQKPLQIEGNSEETLTFFMDNVSYFQLEYIEVKKYNNGIAELNGSNIYIKLDNGKKKGPANLDLYLKNHKEYKNSQQSQIEKINSSFELAKLINKNDPEDIIVNSLCGMKNLINTCYINSSFQILIHIPQFIKIIMKNSDLEIGVIKEINNIFEQIKQKYKEYRPIIEPKSFVHLFKSNHYAYNNYSQMDSEMFLEELIWDINTELGDLGEKRKNYLIINKKNKDKIENFNNYIKESEEETHFEINDLFYVYFIHEKKCLKCGYLSYYFDESPGLKLNFEHTKFQAKIDLISLIMDNFKQPIIIKSRILCQNCQQCFHVEETTRIAKLPEILILSLQKVNDTNTRKIPWLVQFSPKIAIREIVDIDLINKSCIYQIFAINNHSGDTPKSGHYFSQIYLEKLKSWFFFNDEYVDKEPNLIAPKLSNYILFYKHVKL